MSIESMMPYNRLVLCYPLLLLPSIFIAHNFLKEQNYYLRLKAWGKEDLFYSTGNSAQCYVAAWMGGGFGEEWIHVCVLLSPFAVHLKLTQHC